MKIVVFSKINPFISNFDGESTKMTNIYHCLQNRYGNENVDFYRAINYWPHIVRFIKTAKPALLKYDAVIFEPGGLKGLIFYGFFMRSLKRRGIKIIYPVVGGAVYAFFKKYKLAAKQYQTFDLLLCETNGLCRQLQFLGFKNVVYSPVFSTRARIQKSLLVKLFPESHDSSFRFCTFSRVNVEKGISLACQAVIAVNKSGAVKKPVKLDVFGKCDASYLPILNSLILESGGMISYGGIVPDDKVMFTLARHYCALFPTHFSAECFPSSVLECNMAGLPVIASKWAYNSEFIDEGINGFLFSLNEDGGLERSIISVCQTPHTIETMHLRSLASSERFTSDNCLKPLFCSIEQK